LVVAWAVVARHSAAVVAWADESLMIVDQWLRWEDSITVHTERRQTEQWLERKIDHESSCQTACPACNLYLVGGDCRSAVLG
jgi:hypothetical protein